MSWRWEARRSNTTISKVPFLGYSSSWVLSYCSSEALFFMIRNTEMDSEHFVNKYSLSFCVKSWCLYYAAFYYDSEWILISGLLGVRTCWIIVYAHLWSGNVLFLVSVMTNWCSWVMICAQNSSGFCLMSLMVPFKFFWHVKQVCIYKFTLIFLQLEEDSGAINVQMLWVPIQLLIGDKMEGTLEELWLYEPSWYYFFRFSTTAWYSLEWQTYLWSSHSGGQWEVLVDSNPSLLSMLPLKLAC